MSSGMQKRFFAGLRRNSSSAKKKQQQQADNIPQNIVNLQVIPINDNNNNNNNTAPILNDSNSVPINNNNREIINHHGDDRDDGLDEDGDNVGGLVVMNHDLRALSRLLQHGGKKRGGDIGGAGSLLPTAPGSGSPILSARSAARFFQENPLPTAFAVADTLDSDGRGGPPPSTVSESGNSLFEYEESARSAFTHDSSSAADVSDINNNPQLIVWSNAAFCAEGMAGAVDNFSAAKTIINNNNNNSNSRAPNAYNIQQQQKSSKNHNIGPTVLRDRRFDDGSSSISQKISDGNSALQGDLTQANTDARMSLSSVVEEPFPSRLDLGYNDSGSQLDEAKLRAELEIEIEKDLEQEIKRKISDLSKRLEELHTIQSARSSRPNPEAIVTWREGTDSMMTTPRQNIETGLSRVKTVPNIPIITSEQIIATTPEGRRSNTPNLRTDGRRSTTPNLAADRKRLSTPNLGTDGIRRSMTPNLAADGRRSTTPINALDGKRSETPNLSADGRRSSTPNLGLTDRRQSTTPNIAAVDGRRSATPNLAKDGRRSTTPNLGLTDRRRSTTPNLAGDRRRSTTPNLLAERKKSLMPNVGTDGRRSTTPNLAADGRRTSRSTTPNPIIEAKRRSTTTNLIGSRSNADKSRRTQTSTRKLAEFSSPVRSSPRTAPPTANDLSRYPKVDVDKTVPERSKSNLRSRTETIRTAARKLGTVIRTRPSITDHKNHPTKKVIFVEAEEKDEQEQEQEDNDDEEEEEEEDEEEEEEEEEEQESREDEDEEEAEEYEEEEDEEEQEEPGGEKRANLQIENCGKNGNRASRMRSSKEKNPMTQWKRLAAEASAAQRHTEFLQAMIAPDNRFQSDTDEAGTSSAKERPTITYHGPSSSSTSSSYHDHHREQGRTGAEGTTSADTTNKTAHTRPQKFDWVKTLRTGAASNTPPPSSKTAAVNKAIKTNANHVGISSTETPSSSSSSALRMNEGGATTVSTGTKSVARKQIKARQSEAMKEVSKLSNNRIATPIRKQLSCIPSCGKPGVEGRDPDVIVMQSKQATQMKKTAPPPITTTTMTTTTTTTAPPIIKPTAVANHVLAMPNYPGRFREEGAVGTGLLQGTRAAAKQFLARASGGSGLDHGANNAPPASTTMNNNNNKQNSNTQKQTTLSPSPSSAMQFKTNQLNSNIDLEQPNKQNSDRFLERSNMQGPVKTNQDKFLATEKHEYVMSLSNESLELASQGTIVDQLQDRIDGLQLELQVCQNELAKVREERDAYRAQYGDLLEVHDIHFDI